MTIAKTVSKAFSSTRLTRPMRRTTRLLSRVWGDKSGVASVEFAFIAPVMLVLYFGLVEISLLVEADRNVTHAASLVGDLAAQDPDMDLVKMENYINAALAIVGTDATDSTKVGVELTSFEAVMGVDSDGAPERQVNEIGFASFGPSYDGGTHFDGSTIEERLLTPGSGIVVARINFQYESPLQYFVKSPVLKETFFLKPRRSATVEFDNGAPVNKEEMACAIQGTTTFNVNCYAGGTVSTPSP